MHLYAYLFSLLLVALATCISGSAGVKTGCVSEFQGKCRCKLVPDPDEDSDDQSKKPSHMVTNCTNSEFDNDAMLVELPINSAQLVFTGNRINKIRSHVFGTVRYPKLKLVDLSNNNIRRIDPQAFKTATQHVQELSLSGNIWELDDDSNIFMDFPSLRTLHLVGAFYTYQPPDEVLGYLQKYFEEATEQMVHLEILHLEDNNFENFQDDSFFCLLPNLKELYLSNNKISSFNLTPRCLSRLLHLELIDLSHNKLSLLNVSTMHALDAKNSLQPSRERQVDLNDNVFPCNCSLNRMLHWMHETTIQFVNKELYTCSVVNPSDDTSTMRLADLKNRRLPCLEATVQPPAAAPVAQSPSNAGYIVLATILVILIAISIGLAYVNRTAVHHFLRHRTSPLQTKFEYSTIGGRREASEVDV